MRTTGVLACHRLRGHQSHAGLHPSAGPSWPARPPLPCPTDWASKTGQDWIANHALPQIDFAAFHIWSDNWAK